MAATSDKTNEEEKLEKIPDKSCEDIENELKSELKIETQEKQDENKKIEKQIEESQSCSDQSDDERLMVIETPEGLTILETESCCQGDDHSHEDMEFPVDDENVTDNSSEAAVDNGTQEELIEKLTKIRQGEISDLPETVTKLVTPTGCTVYLIGTAHFSKESQEDVAKAIQAIKPDVVVVELCKSRIDILKYDEELLLQEAKNIDMQKLKFAIKQSGVISGIMQVLLLSMSAHITKQLGMAPGGEFRTAYHEAKKIPGCQVHLGDRPIQVTLSRAMSALTLWQKTKLAWHLLTSKQPISKEDVERCKQKDLLAEMLAEMTGDFPLLYKVFVSERDQYLARSLRLSAMPIAVHNQDGEFQGVIPSVVVGVVGIGHTAGITENFDKEIDIQELLKVPPPSKTSKVIKLSIRALIGVLLAWGTYKVLKWTTLTQYLSIPWYN